MRKIDKYISKEKMCNLVVNRAEKLFELSSEESNYLRNRLKNMIKWNCSIYIIILLHLVWMLCLNAYVRMIDYAIASMHAWNYRCGTRAENTEAFINVMKNPCVKILGHSDNTHYPVNYDALARAARETGTIFEINEASLAPYGYRGDTRENCFEILRCCRKYDLPLLLSSDSHGPEHIGDFTCAAEFVHQAMFPEQLILNNQLPRLKVFLQTRE